jgi:hypothetical protein
MSENEEIPSRALPILRLRPTVPTELIRPHNKTTRPDGPQLAHPDFIDSRKYVANGGTQYDPEIPMKEYRRQWKSFWAKEAKELKKQNIELIDAYLRWPSINMQEFQGAPDDEIAFFIEMYYLGPRLYEHPSRLFSRSHDDLTSVALQIAT